MTSIAQKKRLPLYGKWLWTTLVVILGAVVLVRLGFWQIARLEQRREGNAHLRARLAEPPVALTGQLVVPDEVDLRRATARGRYDFDQEIVLRNRALNGAPGVHVITPLRISGSDSALLVDRGWIPYDNASPTQRAAFDRPAGEREVQGIIHRSQPRLNSLSAADPPLSADRPRLDEWFRVDIPRIQQQIPYPLLPVYLEEGLTSAGSLPADTAAGTLPRPDIQIDLSDGPHLYYAIQWLAFAIILLAGYVTLFLKQTSNT